MKVHKIIRSDSKWQFYFWVLLTVDVFSALQKVVFFRKRKIMLSNEIIFLIIFWSITFPRFEHYLLDIIYTTVKILLPSFDIYVDYRRLAGSGTSL